MKLLWKLTIACIKMFYREKEAVFWTMFLPLFMIVLFGFVKFDNLGSVQLGIVNHAGNKAGELIKELKKVQTLDITLGDESAEEKLLSRGERDLVLVIPSGYPDAELHVLLNNAKPQETQLGVLIVQRIVDANTIKDVPGLKPAVLRTQIVSGRKLTYMDFLLPGILAMSIMQMGIFGVAFTFVDLKKRGILKRLRVTPIRTRDFILAQVITRLLVLMLQIVVLVGAGMLFFRLNFIGSLWNMFALGLLGAIAFLGMGFAVAGVSKSEDQVAPLANVISIPMMLLSGIFFSRANLPGFAHVITSIFPLTFLADALRSIAIDGAVLYEVMPQILGLSIWSLLTCTLAVKLFRWE